MSRNRDLANIIAGGFTADDIPNFTGDRKIDFMRTFEKVLDLKNRFKLTEEKAIKQQIFRHSRHKLKCQ